MNIFKYLLVVLACMSTPAFANVFVSVQIAPPPLLVYEQPEAPFEDYIWTPGYWAWDGEGYYWVPGTWVLAPGPGLLWTPGFWAFEDEFYVWHPGYWGPHVGFYGGINYGYGYTGYGYHGGYWVGRHFCYNRAVNRINIIHVHNTYNETVVNNITINRVSYNGGDGIRARPTSREERAEHEHHRQVTAEQAQHEIGAQNNPQQHFTVNHGEPAILSTDRPANFANANGRNTGKDRFPSEHSSRSGGQRQPEPIQRDATVLPQSNAQRHGRSNEGEAAPPLRNSMEPQSRRSMREMPPERFGIIHEQPQPSQSHRDRANESMTRERTNNPQGRPPPREDNRNKDHEDSHDRRSHE